MDYPTEDENIFIKRVEMAAARCFYWIVRGHIQYVRAYLKKALEGLELLTTPIAQQCMAAGYRALGHMAYRQADYEEASKYYKLCSNLLRRMGDRVGRADLATNFGNIHFSKGKWKRARTCYLAALAVSDTQNNRWAIAINKKNLGMVEEALGQIEIAIDYYRQSLVLERADGSFSELVNTLLKLCGALLERYGRLGPFTDESSLLYSEAQDCCQEAYDIAVKIKYEEGKAHSIVYRARIEQLNQDFNAALVHLIEALRIYEQMGDKYAEADARLQLARIYTELNSIDEACAEFKAYLAVSERVINNNLRCYIANDTGELCRYNFHRPKEALWFYQQALSLHEGQNDLTAGIIFCNIAETELQLGMIAIARLHLEQSLVLMQRFGDPPNIISGLYCCVDLLALTGQSRQAIRLLAAVTNLRHNLKMPLSEEDKNMFRSRIRKLHHIMENEQFRQEWNGGWFQTNLNELVQFARDAGNMNSI